MRTLMAALALLLLLFPLAMPAADSEPVTDVIAVHNVVWSVTKGPLDSSYLDGNIDPSSIYVSEDPNDTAFSRYMDGETSLSELALPEIQEGKDYYLYFVEGTVLNSASHGRIQLDSLEHARVPSPSPTVMDLEKGSYTFTTEANIDGDSVMISSGTTVAGNWPYLGGLTFRIFQDGVYTMYLNYDDYHCVRFKVASGDVNTLQRMSGSTAYELSTSYHWARAEFDVGAGPYTFPHPTFVAGSDDDIRFRSEVAEKLSTDAQWTIGEVSFGERTRLAQYQLVSADGMSIVYYSGPPTVQDPVTGRISAAQGTTIRVDDPETIGTDYPRSVSLFAPAHQKLVMAATYDSARYAVMLDVGGRSTYLASDCRYDLEFDEATQIDVRVDPVFRVWGPDRFSTTVMLTAEGVPEPDGLAPAFIVACVGACLAVMALLFVSSRPPRWDDRSSRLRTAPSARSAIEPKTDEYFKITKEKDFAGVLPAFMVIFN